MLLEALLNSLALLGTNVQILMQEALARMLSSRFATKLASTKFTQHLTSARSPVLLGFSTQATLSPFSHLSQLHPHLGMQYATRFLCLIYSYPTRSAMDRRHSCAETTPLCLQHTLSSHYTLSPVTTQTPTDKHAHKTASRPACLLYSEAMRTYDICY